MTWYYFGVGKARTQRNMQIATARLAGDTLSEIAAAYGITKQRVSQIVRRSAKKPTCLASYRERLTNLWLAGKLTFEIADAVGATEQSVYRSLRRMKLKPNKRPLWDRLARHFEFASGCWIWRGGQNGDGYGVLKTRPKGRSRFAHRLVYEELTGAIDDSLVIDHLCREKLCVNPAHLEEVTSAENSRRGVHVGKKRKVPLCPTS